MKICLLGKSGTFFKANLHTHSTVSDGVLTPEELKTAYQSRGYSVLAFTDHDVVVSHNDLTDENFLALTACEMEINPHIPDGDFSLAPTYHLNFLAKSPDNTLIPCFSERYVWLPQTKPYITEEMRQFDFKRSYTVECVNAMIEKANEAGFLVAYNHPVWSLQNYADYAELKGLWGVECFNHTAARGGLTDTEQPFCDLLKNGNKIYPLATDDAHMKEDLFGGFVMIEAEKLDYSSVIQALEKGAFYSSTGPSVHQISFDDGKVEICCSEAAKIILSTDRRFGFTLTAKEKEPLECACFDLSAFLKGAYSHDIEKYPAYFRITVIDERGNKAWSRAYFTDELIEKKA